jgi:signal transduction histidine kinase
MPSPSTILIVDDQLIGRETLEALLTGQGYHLILARSGLETLTKAQEFQPDLILLDVMMPGMDGFEVCRRLRADPILAEVPIIMVTTLDDRQSRLQAFDAGADDFISKPFDSVELRMRVRSITRINRYHQLINERSQRHLMEAKQAFMNKLTANIAHELLTPLSVITLLGGNLERLYHKLDDTKRLKMIHDIRWHTHLLHELVENTLHITRLDAQVASTDEALLDVVELTQEELAKQLPLAQQKGQTIQVQGNESLSLYGQENKLRQVVRNLLNNAIKYTPQSGIITFEWSQFPSQNQTTGWPNAPTTGQWAGFRVVDTGPGIAEADQPHLFDRFYRVQNQSNLPGMGLGLSIVKEVVEQQGGQLGVYSRLGEGTTFTIYLPIDKTTF